MVICMRREVVIQNKDVIKKTIHCLSRRKSLLLRFLVSCWYNWCQTACPPQQHLTLVFGNWVEAGGDGEDEGGEEQCVPHDPHPGPICRTYGQQEFSVYKFVPPPTTTPPHSSKLFALKILTKELSQMPECLHAQAANSRCSKRMRFCIQRRCFLCQVFRQSKECFEGNIYNIRQNPLRSKSCHSLVDPPKY